MDIAGKITGILVFLAGVALLGLVFVYTVRTIDGAEEGIRRGDLMMPPLFGDSTLPAPPHLQPDPPAVAEAPEDENGDSGPVDTGAEDSSSDGGDEDAEDEEGMSPIVLFGMALGARVIGLCALGFLAGIIATQGARMSGAFRSSRGKEPAD